MINPPTVLEAKRFEVYTCSLDTPLHEACRKMAAEDVSCLVINDDNGHLAGILTRTDLLRARLESEDWVDRPTADYMNREVITVTPETTLADVARLLTQHHIHRVVVARSEEDKLLPLGVVSDSDLIYHMAYRIGL